MSLLTMKSNHYLTIHFPFIKLSTKNNTLNGKLKKPLCIYQIHNRISKLYLTPDNLYFEHKSLLNTDDWIGTD